MTETPEFTPFPTPITDVLPFPNGMYCNEIERDLGTSWYGITIGISTFDEFQEQLFSLNEEYFVIERSNPDNRGIVFRLPNDVAVENQLPRTVVVCTNNNIVVSLKTSDSAFQEPSIYLDDWIVNLGLPDTVTWGASGLSRVVFWFEEGIALDVFIGEPQFGAILSTVYFPFQEIEGYEDRFPYNQTTPESFVGDMVRQPPLPTMQNPFDFDAIVATVTAQPSRTPTATFEPPIVTATVTP